jgi:preprotein translocase subunit SecA
MLSLFKKLFLDNNQKLLNKLYPIVEKINSLEPAMQKLSDDQLRGKTQEFKDLLASGLTLEDILPQAFATIREASVRVFNKRHFDVQLMGGIVLHNSMIAEMLTGEGKTLVATLPAYLNSLVGKGVHVITVNDYLAKRDSQEMGKLYSFLGLSVGCLVSDLPEEQRQNAYLCDITYGTNNEFGFDYLRDNMKLSMESLCQRDFYYAIIDEVDSVLIDESRTPLIISGKSTDKTDLYKVAKDYVKHFELKIDFELDEKNKSVNITEAGLEKLENLLTKAGLILKGSLFDSNNIGLYHLLTQAIKAHHLYKKEVDYIVKDNQVLIIDEFTGRIMDGRRFSDGMHQALEAKEGIKIRSENQTLASITYQNYFKMYPKLCGMTGTAKTEESEFLEIYGLKVVQIPSNKKVARIDKNDEIYLTYKDKEKAIVKKIQELYEKKQPVLIGTVSIEKSESLSNALKQAKIPHNVLNAKHHDKEAAIIANAGKLGAITIATNMAGRGTDIQLGGNLEMIISQMDLSKLSIEAKLAKINEISEAIAKEKQEVLTLGGLYIVGTERHESRRIDNQLRGRSARQGEVGCTMFYISLEDDLMRIFGSNKLEGTLKRLGFKDDEAISHPLISKSIEKAQKRVEAYNFEIRKSLLKFDNVINEQRKLIYSQRRELMANKMIVAEMIENNTKLIIDNLISSHFPENEYREKWNLSTAKADLSRLLNIHDLDLEDLTINQALDIEEIEKLIVEKSSGILQSKKMSVNEDLYYHSMQNIILQLLDYAWKKHLLELDYVRSAINLRAYANKDPFNEYQQESFILFSNMIDEFKEKLVSVSHHIEYEKTN